MGQVPMAKWNRVNDGMQSILWSWPLESTPFVTISPLAERGGVRCTRASKGNAALQLVRINGHRDA